LTTILNCALRKLLPGEIGDNEDGDETDSLSDTDVRFLTGNDDSEIYDVPVVDARRSKKRKRAAMEESDHFDGTEPTEGDDEEMVPPPFASPFHANSCFRVRQRPKRGAKRLGVSKD